MLFYMVNLSKCFRASVSSTVFQAGTTAIACVESKININLTRIGIETLFNKFLNQKCTVYKYKNVSRHVAIITIPLINSPNRGLLQNISKYGHADEN